MYNAATKTLDRNVTDVIEAGIQQLHKNLNPGTREKPGEELCKLPCAFIQTSTTSVASLHLPRTALAWGLCFLLAACGTNIPQDAQGDRHITEASIASQPSTSPIPSIVTPVPLVTPPHPQDEPELYTVIAQDIPVRDLLFSMARDSGFNVDVHPDVAGLVSINAIDQSLPQILERISRQLNLRWSFDTYGNLVIETDSPFWKNYRVDYVNVTRTSSTDAQIATAIASTGGGTSSSGSTMNQISNNNFWPTLTANLNGLLTDMTPGATASTASSIIANPESGVISVFANTFQHEGIANFLNSVQTRSLYQVLIEATVVEVNLNDQYQSGVDWSALGRDSGALSFVQNVTSSSLATAPTNILTINRSATSAPDAIKATISLLSQFGELRVLSSPTIMALNNQAAMLRVVDNTVYFTIDVQAGTPATGVSPGTPPVYTTTVHTVPVGFVMTVTPQVGENDQVTLNVRPTISRIVRYVNDPSPILSESGVVNAIPEIQVQEIESILKVFSGEVAVLGGLMQDSVRSNVDGLPTLSRMPGIRNLFSYRDEIATKTELIVFIRPVVVRQASLDGDLSQYRSFLPENGVEPSSPDFPTGATSRPSGE